MPQHPVGEFGAAAVRIDELLGGRIATHSVHGEVAAPEDFHLIDPADVAELADECVDVGPVDLDVNIPRDPEPSTRILVSGERLIVIVAGE